MITHRYPSIRLILSFVLIAAPLAALARGDSGVPPKPVRSAIGATFGPLGTVYASGAMAINHRRVQGQQMVWSGDLLETPAEAEAHAKLDQIGQVMLTNNATVRFAAGMAEPEDESRGPVLVIALGRGGLAVRLESEASAYIEAGDAAYTSSRGACFRIEISEGRAVIHEASGAVTIKPQIKTVTIKSRGVPGRPGNSEPVKLSRREKARLKASYEKITRTSNTRLVAYKRSASPIAAGTQSDEVVEKLARYVVDFEVRPPGIGNVVNQADQVINSALTDDQGVVTVYFRAGDNRAVGQVIATPRLGPGDPPNTIIESYTWEVTIEKPGIFRTRNRFIMAAAAGIIVGCCVIPRDPSKPPQNPPPQIKP